MSACQIFGIVAVLSVGLLISKHPEFNLTGYVLDSSGYGLAAFRVAGALGLSSRFQQRDVGVPRRPGGPPYLGCCRSNYLSQADTQLRLFGAFRLRFGWLALRFQGGQVIYQFLRRHLRNHFGEFGRTRGDFRLDDGWGRVVS